jgi:hypothetical protein
MTFNTYQFGWADLSQDAPQRPVPFKTLSDARRLFQRLSSMVQPGLTETEFRNLFTKCGVGCSTEMSSVVYQWVAGTTVAQMGC